VFIVADGPVS
jgi:dihydroxyacetone kinase DhaKLM complex PTS-EIIA-like component DhaM